MRKIITISILVGCLSGCASFDDMSKTKKGALIGGGSGVLIGGAAAGKKGAVIGGVAGALGGGVVGHKMEKDDEKESE